MANFRPRLLAMFLLAFALLSPLAARAQEGLTPGATGVTRGVVVEVTHEYLLLRPAGEAPRRVYLKAAGGSTAAPAEPRVKAGDYVEARWTFNERQVLSSVAIATPPATAPAIVHPAYAPGGETAASAPASAPGMALVDGAVNSAGARTTTGDRVNALIDNLVATGNRLLELPLVMLMAGVAVVGLGVAGATARLFRKSGRVNFKRAAMVMVPVAGAVLGLLIIDRKIAHLQAEVAAVRAKSTSDRTALLETLATKSSRRDKLFIEVSAINKALTPMFGEVSIRPLVYDDATDLYQVHTNNPLDQVWLTVVDLTHPGVEIKLQADFNLKTLTSTFAKENGCSVAINGEAGRSPEQGSGLGTWQGYMVKEGKVLMQETAGDPRPFLAFGAKNRASFIPMAAKDRTLPTDVPMVIWGRLDVLINGEIQRPPDMNRQPRTAMAINAEGTKLYLMVVDGRQPRYSNGMSRLEMGTFLKAFGAYNGMLCDEGGSSCMYLEQFGGIANVPSDNSGQERATYTHFGISMKGK